MWKTPVGIALGAVTLVLAVSPNARKTARKWAVKATEYVLDASEQARSAAGDIRGKLQTAVQEVNPLGRDRAK